MEKETNRVSVKMFSPEEIAAMSLSIVERTIDTSPDTGIMIDTAVEELNFWRTMRKYQKLTNQMDVMGKLLAAMEVQAKEYEAIIEAGLPEYDVEVEVKEAQ